MRALNEDLFEADNDHPFSYSRLSAMKWDSIDCQALYGNYSAYVEADADSDFITLEKNETRTDKKEKFSRTISKGIKVHISISDLHNDDKNLANAWQIVYTTVMVHQIKKIKIVKNEAREFMRSDGDKAGKEITWYFFKDRLEDTQVQDFLNDLTRQFVRYGIIPGPVAKHDHGVINGSHYFSYRNDKSVSSSDVPFQAVRISVEEQPSRRAPPDFLSSALGRDTVEDRPKQISMEDSASNDPKEYNDEDGPDDSSCCSGTCP